MNARAIEASGGVNSVIITYELSRRPSRSADFESENQVLLKLAHTMASDPATVLQQLTNSACDLCRAASVGISLLDPDLHGDEPPLR